MTSKNLLAVLLLLALLAAGCRPRTVVKIVEVTVPPEPTASPLPPTVTPGPVTVTVCASGCDFATIQAAVDDESTIAGSTIRVTDPVHTESEITIDKGVIVQGQGAGDTIVQAHAEAGRASDRVFFVGDGVSVAIRDMTIRHGRPDLEPKVRGVRRCGGGVANLGTLTLDRVVVTANTASGGGGIWNKGALTIVDSTLSDNVADGKEQAGFGCGTGGGIKSVDGRVTLARSTISGNRAKGLGGGMQVSCATTVELTNSTISGNISGGRGGAVHVKGVVVLVNTTISGNSAAGGAGGILHRGVMSFTNSIVAYNDGGDCVVDRHSSASEEMGTTGTNVNNLVGDGSCDATYSGDPLLGSLADNGGHTLTHALLPGSPALDATECTIATDQRGAPRPQGAACDLGAFEAQAGE